PGGADGADRSQSSAEIQAWEHLAWNIGDSQLLTPVGIAAIARGAVNEDAIVTGGHLQEERRREQVSSIHYRVLSPVVDIQPVGIRRPVVREVGIGRLLGQRYDVPDKHAGALGEFVIDAADVKVADVFIHAIPLPVSTEVVRVVGSAVRSRYV